MSCLSEKFDELKSQYDADVEALRAASGLVNEAEALAESLVEFGDNVFAAPAITVSMGKVSVRILSWSHFHAVRRAIEKAGLVVQVVGESEMCGKPADTIMLAGIATPIIVQRPDFAQAA